MILIPINTNLTAVKIKKATIFFSYSTPVALTIHDTSMLYITDKYYSKTTSKHIEVLKNDFHAHETKIILTEQLNTIISDLLNTDPSARLQELARRMAECTGVSNSIKVEAWFFVNNDGTVQEEMHYQLWNQVSSVKCFDDLSRLTAYVLRQEVNNDPLK